MLEIVEDRNGRRATSTPARRAMEEITSNNRNEALD
jgi:hypothetical protein